MAYKSLREKKYVLCTGEVETADKLAKHLNSHVVGELQQLMRDQLDLTVCAVYASSRRVTQALSPPPVIRVYVIGDAIIPCDLCSRRRDWGISKSGLTWLLSRIYKNYSAGI